MNTNPSRRATNHFEVCFTVYQFNSGAGDNGSYKRSQKFDTEIEAREFASKINEAIEYHHIQDKWSAQVMSRRHGQDFYDLIVEEPVRNEELEEWADEMSDRYVWHGYFESVDSIKYVQIVEQFLELESNG